MLKPQTSIHSIGYPYYLSYFLKVCFVWLKYTFKLARVTTLTLESGVKMSEGKSLVLVGTMIWKKINNTLVMWLKWRKSLLLQNICQTRWEFLSYNTICYTLWYWRLGYNGTREIGGNNINEYVKINFVFRSTKEDMKWNNCIV